MSIVYITSDWHLGHKNIFKYRTQFKTREEHEAVLIQNYMSLVTKRDTVWFLGDMCFNNEACRIIKNLPGDKRLVLGNHDTDRKTDIEQLVLTFDQVHGLAKYKDAWLSHAPIHPSELRGRFNIHGHAHFTCVEDARYFNACVEHTEYRPMKYQDILALLKNEGK